MIMKNIAAFLLAGFLFLCGAGEAFAQISPGTAWTTQVKVDFAKLSAMNATGGSGTYTFQWYRSTTFGVNGSPISSATTLAVIATSLSPATTYYFSLQYNDGSSTAFTPQVTVTTLPASAKVVVGAAGDSIMAGYESSAPVASQYMVNLLNERFLNKEFIVGSNSAIGGTTSTDWAAGGADLNAAISNFNSTGVTHVILMLGTNDAKISVATPTATYQSNIQGIVNALFTGVSTLQKINIFSSPFLCDTILADDLSMSDLGRLNAYANTLPSIADNVKTFYVIPRDSYNYFQDFPSDLNSDCIHPNSGAPLGTMWANAVAATYILPAPLSGSPLN